MRPGHTNVVLPNLFLLLFFFCDDGVTSERLDFAEIIRCGDKGKKRRKKNK